VRLVLHDVRHPKIDGRRPCAQYARTVDRRLGDVERDDLIGDVGERTGQKPGAAADLQ
jgi:hypothetical protein